MKKTFLAMFVGAAAMIGVSSPAQAQFAVVDVRAIAQHIQTVRNTLAQLQEAQRLYQAMNSLSQVRNVSQLLNDPLVHNALPQGMQDSLALISTDLRQLGAIGQEAQALLNNRNLSLQDIDGTLGQVQASLAISATVNARNQAYGQRLLTVTEATSNGLNQLSSGLSSATTLRDATDINARAAIENAAVSNRILQLMAQERADAALAGVNSAEGFAATQRQNEADAAVHRRPTINLPSVNQQALNRQVAQ